MKAADIRKTQTIKLQGKEYFQVAGRIVEFRRDNPEHTIETEFRMLNEQPHMFAAIRDPSGRLLATAHKRVRSDAKGPAGQYPFETAETGAIGRALGLMGYGTLGGDFEEGDQIADAPIDSDTKQQHNPWK